MIDFLTGLLVFCAAATATACAVAKLIIENGKCRIKERSIFDRERANPQFYILHSPFSIHTAVFVFFAAIATLSAQKSGTNSPPRGGNVELRMENVELRNVSHLVESEQIHHSPFSILHSQLSIDDVARGYLLECVATNDFYSYAMPANGLRYDKWWKRGGYEDVFRFDLGGMRFPLGTNLCASLWVYTWGMVGVRLADASNRLVATGVPMSAVPGRSQSWSADAAGGAKLLTWENFFLNRDTNTPVSAQLELYPSGNFIARSNNVERLYHRVNPDDWDDDGIPNDEDDEPLIAGEPAFGAAQQLPPGANTNAYCWIDVVVANANSLVTFSGEGNSTLADPSFIARAGETNRVTLLIGKPYHVSSRVPMTCVAQSSAAIEVSQDSPTSLSVLWPVTIEVENGELRMKSGGGLLRNSTLYTLHSQFSMSVIPDFLGGGFTWTNSCCSISSSGWSFTYSCNDACHCTGCSALGCYTYEGFSLPASGGSCGCSSEGEYDEPPEEEDDEGPYEGGASATFSKSAVIFEDPYENSPGVWIGRHSTTTELHCVAHGGPYGGHVRFEIVGSEKLARVSGHVLPVEQDVSPGKKLDFTIIYTGQLPSMAAEDIIVTTTFTENISNATQEQDEEKLTSVKVELEAVYVAPENTCSHRHEYGVGEKVKFAVSPTVSGALMQVDKADSGDRATVYDTFGGELSVSAGGMHVYTCPASGTAPDITIYVVDAEYFPIMTVVEPQMVVTTNATGIGSFWPGDVVMGTLRTVNCIGPMTVSFQGVKMLEVPCTNAILPTGYFDTTNYTGYLTHTADAGAGWVHRIGEGNYWTIDEAGRSIPYPNWSSGQLIWKIPIGWKRLRYDDDNSTCADNPDHEYLWNPNSRPLLIGNSEDAYTQIFSISGNGASSVEKFGHRLLRSRWSISGEVSNIQ